MTERIKLTEKDISMSRCFKFVKPSIVIPCNRETDYLHFKNQILQDQEKAKRLDEVIKDQEISCGEYVGKRDYDPEYIIARNILIKLQKIRDGEKK